MIVEEEQRGDRPTFVRNPNVQTSTGVALLEVDRKEFDFALIGRRAQSRSIGRETNASDVAFVIGEGQMSVGEIVESTDRFGKKRFSESIDVDHFDFGAARDAHHCVRVVLLVLVVVGNETTPTDERNRFERIRLEIEVKNQRVFQFVRLVEFLDSIDS